MTSEHIGTLTEKSLHAALKEWAAKPGDEVETRVDGFVIDILRGENLIEIQTRNFSSIRRKLETLLENGRRVHLMHPIAAKKWIVRQTEGGEPVGRRRSPKRGRPIDIFQELVRIPHLLGEPNFSVEVVLIELEEVLRDDGRGSWRRKGWSRHDSLLVSILGTCRFHNPEDYLAQIPREVPRPLTNRTLAKAAKIHLSLAQKMTYTLHKAGWLDRVGKKGRAYLYTERVF